MDTGNIKIGVSKDVQKRLETFRSMVCSNANVHEYFKEYHVRGEWYKVKEHEVIKFLEHSNYLLKINNIEYMKRKARLAPVGRAKLIAFV